VSKAAARKQEPEQLAVVYRPLADLIPYARNSRTHSDAQIAQIAASIREFSFTNPVLTDELGGIIAGHGRVLAARQLGLELVPCIELRGLSETQKRAYVIADNKLALNAGWDEELLAVELQGLVDEGFDFALTGFDQGELDALLKGLLAQDGNLPGELGDEPTHTQMTFTLSHRQKTIVEAALAAAKDVPGVDQGDNDNSNGNALAAVCEAYCGKR
jgi:ParB-like chromosome segregation protein Spo0J